MSKLYYTIKLNEVETTKDGDFIREYVSNLPHAKEIANNFCESWNSVKWNEIFDGIFAGQVKTSKMHPMHISNDGICKVQITTTLQLTVLDCRKNAEMLFGSKWKLKCVMDGAKAFLDL